MKLSVHNLGWLSNTLEQQDLCAHGDVEVQIGGETLEQPSGRDWCVSAAALFLLRTLTRDHTASSRVGDQLIPCCGHTMYVNKGSDDVEICNCNNGVDWEVRHVHNTVILQTLNGSAESVSVDEWKHTVFQFADTVERFYIDSLPKEPNDDYDAQAFIVFKAEWSRRRGKIFGNGSN